MPPKKRGKTEESIEDNFDLIAEIKSLKATQLELIQSINDLKQQNTFVTYPQEPKEAHHVKNHEVKEDASPKKNTNTDFYNQRYSY